MYPGAAPPHGRDWGAAFATLQGDYGTMSSGGLYTRAAVPVVPSLVHPQTQILPATLHGIPPERPDIASAKVISASEARRKNPPLWSCSICEQTFTTRTNCEGKFIGLSTHMWQES
jgi:hypothetical protein